LINSVYKAILIAIVCLIAVEAIADNRLYISESPLVNYSLSDPNTHENNLSSSTNRWIYDIFAAVAFGDRKGELYTFNFSIEENKPQEFRWAFQPFMGVGNSRDEATLVVGFDTLFKVPVFIRENASIDFEGGVGLQEAGRRSFPSKGTHFNWRPQLGFSLRCGDTERSMIFGIRYLHISHGGVRKGGNPGVEELLLYTGFQIRF